MKKRLIIIIISISAILVGVLSFYIINNKKQIIEGEEIN